MSVVRSLLSIVKDKALHPRTIFRHGVSYHPALLSPRADCWKLIAEGSLIDASLNEGHIIHSLTIYDFNSHADYLECSPWDVTQISQ